jgi:parallel beta-helix repeat protein
MRSFCFGAVVALSLSLCSSFGAHGTEVNVPGKYPTIQAAIDAASPGDTVKIKEGVYNETLNIREGVNLVGADPDKVTIQGPVERGVLLSVSGVKKGSLTGITFQHVNEETGQNLQWPDLLVIKDSQFSVSNCAFKNGAGCGIVIQGQSNVKVSDCRCENNVQYGIIVHDGANASLRSNICSKNHDAGIEFKRAGCGVAEKNKCEENKSYGILISGKDSSATLRENTCSMNGNGVKISSEAKGVLEGNICQRNTYQGICLDSGASAKLVKNLCDENGYIGMSVIMYDTHAELSENFFRHNLIAGLWVYWGGHCEASGNIFIENGRSGISVGGWRSTCVLRDNKICQNSDNGIACYSQASVKTSGNEIRENKGKGYLIADEGTIAESSRDVLEGNGQNDVAREPGLPLNRQQWIVPEAIGYAFSKEKFDLLDELLEGLYKNKPLFTQEEPALLDFYQGITDGADDKVPDNHDAYASVIDRWIKAYPESPAPLCAIAIANVNYAEKTPGSGVGGKATEKGMRDATELLTIAEKFLEAAAKKATQDPYVYATWISTKLPLGVSDKEIDDLFKRGIAADKDFMLLYQCRMHSLSPDWGGSSEKMDAFIEESCKNPDFSKEDADFLYAILASLKANFFENNPNSVLTLSWPRVDEGFKELLRRFPEDYFNLNRYCFLACAFKEKNRAKELFGKISEAPDQSAWINNLDVLEAYKNWAEQGGEYPVKQAQNQNSGSQSPQQQPNQQIENQSSQKLQNQPPREQVNQQIQKPTLYGPLKGAIILLVVFLMIAAIVRKYGKAEF